MSRSLGGALRVLVVAVAAVALLGACSSKGKAKEPAKLVKIENRLVRPHEVWSRRIGDGGGKYYSGLRVAVADDALFAGALNGRVYALDPKNGHTIWRARTKARVISGPTLDDALVLVGTLDGEVIALKRADGSQVWRGQAPSEALAPPVGSGDTVVAKAVDGRVYGLDAASGSHKWTFDRNEPNLSLRGLSPPLILGERVYVGMDNGKLAQLGLADGQAVWEQTITVPTGRSDVDRMTDIDADLLPSGDGLYVVTFGGDLTLIDLASGNARWRRSVRSYSGMALGGDKLFVSDDAGTVWAFDAASGAVAWKQPGFKNRRLSPPAVFQGFVVVGDFDGHLHWLSTEDGKVVGRNRVGSDPITAAPIVAGDLMYVMNSRGLLEAFEARPAK
ncbi:MAG: outer membrane protein assembly factor BamB [Nevskia sp.]|nr:outer membrane protein assembly factor BamB [Nevskia sp.]